jgi:hypothetical protein
LGENTLYIGGAVMIGLALLTCFLTHQRLATTVETFLEIADIHYTWDWDIQGTEAVRAHVKILWGARENSYYRL